MMHDEAPPLELVKKLMNKQRADRGLLFKWLIELQGRSVQPRYLAGYHGNGASFLTDGMLSSLRQIRPYTWVVVEHGFYFD